MAPLLDVLLQHVPPPRVAVDDPFAMCVAMIERDAFVGRVATGAGIMLHSMCHAAACLVGWYVFGGRQGGGAL